MGDLSPPALLLRKFVFRQAADGGYSVMASGNKKETPLRKNKHLIGLKKKIYTFTNYISQR